RHEHDGQEALARHTLKDTARFEPADAGHQDVEQYEVDATLSDALDGKLSVGHRLDDEAVVPQNLREHLARDPVVVCHDDQRPRDRARRRGWVVRIGIGHGLWSTAFTL